MSIVLNGTTGITTPDVTSDSYTGALAVNASAPDNSVVVDASGNLLVGTTSGISGNGAYGTFGNSSAGGANRWAAYFGTNSSSSNPAPNFGLTIGWNKSGGGGESNIVYGTGLGSSPALAFGSSDGTTYTERARIDSNGYFLVGTTAALGSCLTTKNNSGSTAVHAVQHYSTAAANWYMLRFYNGAGTAGGSITLNTSTLATAFNTSSDYRLKEDWVAVADASTRVNALKPVNFAWKATGDRVDGFLAHELAEVVPEAVTGEKDAVELVDIKDEDGNVTGQEERPVYQGIDQSKLVPLLTAALQEALAKIDDLTARVSALEAANV
jgi:hypothetical protein